MEWVRRIDGVVLEDDYDAEFRYDHRSLGAVQGMCPGRTGGPVDRSLPVRGRPGTGAEGGGLDAALAGRGAELADGVAGVVDVDPVALGRALRDAGREVFRHRLRAEVAVIVDGGLSVRPAHEVAVDAEHALLHALPRLTAALVHAYPAPLPGAPDPHLALAHHGR